MSRTFRPVSGVRGRILHHLRRVFTRAAEYKNEPSGPPSPSLIRGGRACLRRRRHETGRRSHGRIRAAVYSPYSCIPALKGERSQKRKGSEYAEYTEYKFRIPYESRAYGPILYAFGIRIHLNTMHTTGACRGRFHPFSAFTTPIGTGRRMYSRGPLNTNPVPTARFRQGRRRGPMGRRQCAAGRTTGTRITADRIRRIHVFTP